MKLGKVGHVRVLQGRSRSGVEFGSVIAKHEQGCTEPVEVHPTTIRKISVGADAAQQISS